MQRIMIAILAAALVAGAQTRDEAERMFKAAQNTEVVDGELNGAIEQYRKISETSDRAIAAEALIRMADAYRKLGDAQAREIYERVVNEFADQANAVTTARERMTAPPDTGGANVLVRQIWAGEDVSVDGSPSKDGRYFAYVEYPSENLAIRDLRTGESRPLTTEAGKGPVHNGVLYPAFSPDAKQVAYQWHEEGTSLRVINSDGSGMRILSDTSDPVPVAWTPDGRQIVAVRGNDDEAYSIALISIIDGSTTQLTSTGRSWPRVGDFSPDGRDLAYAVAGSPSDEDGTVALISADGSRKTDLFRGPVNSPPFWAPDGKTVIFVSDRSGTNGLWAIRVTDGRPEGSAGLVHPNIGNNVGAMGFSTDGSFMYSWLNSANNIYIAGLDTDRLGVTSPPDMLTDRMIGSNTGPSWSPDGESIAFFRGRIASERRLVIRSAISGDERTVLADARNVSSGPYWLPDNTSMLVARNLDERTSFQRLDTVTGEETLVFDGERGRFQAPALSPDGTTLYYTYREPSPTSINHLMKRNLETGEEVELYQAKTPGVSFFGLAVSPDGTRLAFMVNVDAAARELVTLSTEGGAPRVLLRGDYSHPTPSGCAWTPDGRYVLVANAEEQVRQVWAFPADGGEGRPLDIVVPGAIRGLTLSPNGRRVAFTRADWDEELRAIPNLLAGLSAVR